MVTKQEVEKLFMERHAEYSILSETDKVANREVWNNWTDMLCKTGVITEHQYNNWTYPRNKYF